jgi:copper(I)-binding protein
MSTKTDHVAAVRLFSAVAVLAACALTASCSSHSSSTSSTTSTATVTPSVTPSPSVTTSLPPPPSAKMTAGFTGLHNGSRVSYPQQVTGLVSNVPAGMDIWLVVQPLFAPQYWPQSGPLLIVGGQFHGVAYFGQTAAQGSGQEFNLLIVSAPQDASQLFQGFVQKQQVAGMVRLPRDVQPLTLILVKRS